MNSEVRDPLHLDWGFIDQSSDPQIIPDLLRSALSDFKYQLLQYSHPEGLPRLRNAVHEFVHEQMPNANIHQNEILITNGATAGLDLLGRVLLQRRYDSVAFEPSFDTALESLKMNSRKVYGLPINPFSDEFLSPKEWKECERVLRLKNTKLLYINPTFHNPTGNTVSQADRERILDLCIEHDVTLIEDDPYRLYNQILEFMPDAFIDLDKQRKTAVHINSFSKLFFPGIRIGYMIGNEHALQAVTHVQKYTTSSPNLLMQGVCLKAMEEGVLPNIIDSHTAAIKQKMRRCLELIRELKMKEYADFTNPSGGFFVWGQLKTFTKDTDELQQICLEKGVSFVPGKIYFLTQENRTSFRIACSQIQYDDLEPAMKLMREGMQQYLN